MTHRRMAAGLTAAAMLAGMAALAASQAAPPAVKRVQVTGELVDTWCSVTAIMFASGTAHHQCAVWCAVGGIPVSIKDKTGAYYMILRVEGDGDTVANPRLVKIQSHEVEVDGDLIERDGVRYLLVSKVIGDKGVVALTHGENGIVPFGN
jgi:hypothetical protein